MKDVLPTVISQYGNSETLLRLIENMNAYIDPAANIDDFYNQVWNVDTAQGWGLDVWGRIVGVTRNLQVPSGIYLGFEEAGPLTGAPWGQAPWYSGEPITDTYALSDDAFRMLILAKALANICSGSVPAINQILLNLFPGRGNCYVTDGQNMTMTYTFEFALTPVEAAIVGQSGVLPRPVGVAASVVAP